MENYSEHQKTMIIVEIQLAVPNTFTFNNNVIETCKSYPYLGFLISNNRQFQLNISELYKSDSRTMYTLLGNVNKFSSGNVRILLDLFGKIILPICNYNCEVRGASYFLCKFSARAFLAENFFKNLIDKLQSAFFVSIPVLQTRE